jgi:hypothetical protein
VTPPPPEPIPADPAYTINTDACAHCGMSGLEMLQRGELHSHVCDPERARQWRLDRAWAEWRRQVADVA